MLLFLSTSRSLLVQIDDSGDTFRLNIQLSWMPDRPGLLATYVPAVLVHTKIRHFTALGACEW